MECSEVKACPELLSKNKNTMNSPEVWACPKLLSTNKHIVNSVDVWACPILLSKKISNEVSKSLGIHEFRDLNYFW